MNRRDLFRQTLLSAAGIAAASTTAMAVERLPNFDSSKELANADWKPALLDAHQNETLTVVSELIIPRTDTPGAKDALVNRFLDKLMAAERADTQREFLSALAFLDTESRRQFKAAFIHISPADQTDILTFLAYPHSLDTWGEHGPVYEGSQHFSHLKTWISHAYYSSEIGERELGWDGTFRHGEYTGCNKVVSQNQTGQKHE